MMKIVYRILPLLFLMTFIGSANTSQAADKWALLVGINSYQNDISTLKFCISDVEAFRQALVDVAGFKSEKIYLMTDQMTGQNQPNHINIIKRLGILANRIQPDDTFVFYFSGHGISRDGQSFLLATNSDSTTDDTLEVSAVSLRKVSQIVSRIKAQQLLTIIDACRNNPNTGRGDQDNLLSDEFTRGIRIKRASDGSGKPNVSATLYACNVGERAYEWAENKGEVTITGLAEYTQEKVMNWAEEFRGKKQTPWLSLQGGAKLVLADKVGAV